MLWLYVTLGVVGGAAGLYGLHRLALWLEDRGQLYYLRKKPGSIANSAAELQSFLEPQAKYVVRVKEDRKREGGDRGEE